MLSKIDHLKLWLGVLVSRVGADPEQLTLLDAFGYGFSRISSSLTAYWAERAKNAFVSSPSSYQLRNTILTAGGVAEALADLLRNQRMVSHGLRQTWMPPVRPEFEGANERAELLHHFLIPPSS